MPGADLDSWDVERLKGDMSKEVKFYYASLWEGLPPSLKDTLRLVCAFPFFWPRTAFAEIAAKLGIAQPDVAKGGASASLFSGWPKGFPRESGGLCALDTGLRRPHQ